MATPLVLRLAGIDLVDPVQDASLEVEHTCEPDRPQEIRRFRAAAWVRERNIELRMSNNPV